MEKKKNYIGRNAFYVFQAGTCHCKAITVTVPLVLPKI